MLKYVKKEWKQTWEPQTPLCSEEQNMSGVGMIPFSIFMEAFTVSHLYIWLSFEADNDEEEYRDEVDKEWSPAINTST